MDGWMDDWMVLSVNLKKKINASVLCYGNWFKKRNSTIATEMTPMYSCNLKIATYWHVLHGAQRNICDPLCPREIFHHVFPKTSFCHIRPVELNVGCTWTRRTGAAGKSPSHVRASERSRCESITTLFTSLKRINFHERALETCHAGTG